MHLLNYTMPGIKGLLKGWNETNRKDKLGDFAEEYWHYDNITEQMQEQFMESYLTWTKKKGYYQSQNRAAKIYDSRIRQVYICGTEAFSTCIFQRILADFLAGEMGY